MDLYKEIRQIEAFRDVPEVQLQWLAAHGSPQTISKGEYLFKPGDPIDKMLLILDGRFVLKVPQQNNFRVIGEIEPYMVTGFLPYSRANSATGYAEAVTDSHIVTVEKRFFREMILQHEELTASLVHVMSNRIREFTKIQQQNDKMMALGKLSAGLAHELNNPSAAVVRSAHSLREHLALLPEKFKKVVAIKMSEKEIDNVNRLLFSKLQKEASALSMMERSEMEEALIDWLEDRSVDEAEEIAGNLIEFGFNPEDMSIIDQDVPEEHLSPVLNWMNQVLTTERLVHEISDAAKRINDLVLSVKSYTHMDQSPEKAATDVHEGIDNTLVMLGHKLRKENIQLIKDYELELPKASILPSAMNQVWTNLIDNAIDAMKDSEQKELKIKTIADQEFINVYLSDSGAGIPEEIQEKIFDPFFTTKAVGQGTGIGLEVVQRIIAKDHNGSISVKSKPGETTFKVCFPIKS